MTDRRTYFVYRWSGPLPPWRATTTILQRGAIRDERDYQILLACLHGPESSELDPVDIELVRRLVAQYGRDLD